MEEGATATTLMVLLNTKLILVEGKATIPHKVRLLVIKKTRSQLAANQLLNNQVVAHTHACLHLSRSVSKSSQSEIKKSESLA